MKLQRKIVYYIILFVFISALLTLSSIVLYNYTALAGQGFTESFVTSVMLGLAMVFLTTIASMILSWLGFRRWFVSLPVIKRSSINSLRESEQKANAVLENIIDGILTIDSKGIVYSMNPAAENIFGIAKEKVIGRNIRMLMPEPYSSQHDGYLEHYLKTGEKRIIGIGREVTGLRSNGREFSMELSVSEIRVGDERMFTGIVRDITEKKMLEESIKKMAMHDALTGLPNRNLLLERVKQAIALYNRNKQYFSVMLVDIDGFKPVNDNYGHDAGDAVLVEIARRFQGKVRETDMVARIGGDEFLILLCLGPEKEGIARVAAELLEALKPPIPFKGHECRVGASIGVALFPENGKNLDELFKSADEAMYLVKKAGKNNFGFA